MYVAMKSHLPMHPTAVYAISSMRCKEQTGRGEIEPVAG